MLLRTLALWLHVASMVTWFGGLAFYLLIADPALRSSPSSYERVRGIAGLDQRFRHLVWGSVEFSVVTGIALLVITMFQIGTEMHMSAGYMRVLTVKLLLAAAVIGMQLYNHVKINPRKRALAEEMPHHGAPEPPEFLLLQARTRQIFALELVLAAGIVLVGVHMRSMI